MARTSASAVAPGPSASARGGVQRLLLAQRPALRPLGRDRGQRDRLAVDAEGAEAGDEDQHLVEGGAALVDLEAGLAAGPAGS